jgi:hypothetical protein
MERVSPATTAELAKLDPVGIVPLVLGRGVVALLAVGALQGDDRCSALTRCHVFFSLDKNKT